MLIPPDGSQHTFTASELLLDWLVEPKQWENAAFLPASDEVLRRDVLNLPLYDADGRRLCYASPAAVENSPELGRRWETLEQRSAAEGKTFRMDGLNKKIKALVDAYGATAS